MWLWVSLGFLSSWWLWVLAVRVSVGIGSIMLHSSYHYHNSGGVTLLHPNDSRVLLGSFLLVSVRGIARIGMLSLVDADPASGSSTWYYRLSFG
jgi:hypothetical protein